MQVLLGGVFLQALELVRQRLLEHIKHRLDCNFNVAHLQRIGLGARVFAAHARRVLRGHHHRLHPISPQGVHCYRQSQRGIDAARQPQQNAGETILVDVIAHTQHQRLIHLGYFGLLRRNHARLQLPIRNLNKINHFRKHRPLVRELACTVHGKRRAIKHQLILPAHLIDVDDRDAGIRRTLAHNFIASLQLRHVIGRGVQHQQHLCAGIACGNRGGLLPHVLANVDAQAHALMLEHARRITGVEVAHLVEHLVVRQQRLQIRRNNAPIPQHRSRIEILIAHAMRMTDDQRNTRDLTREPGQRIGTAFVEIVAQQQVFRRITADGQLGGQ